MSEHSHPTPLAAFQHQLVEALGDTNIALNSFVAVRLDEEEWLIDLVHLKEASVPSKIARNAGAPNWVTGIANFKGDVWSVIDMRVLLKNKTTANPRWGWVTLLRPSATTLGPQDPLLEQKIGLLWSEIVEIAPKEEYDVSPHTPEQWCKGHYVDKKGKVWRELDVDQISGVGGLLDSWRLRSETANNHLT